MSEQTNGSPGQWSASDAQNAVLPPEASGQAPPPGVTPVMDSAVPPSSNAVSHGPRGAGIWFGAILVLLGVAILIDQFVPGVALWRFWPLIIIVLGLRGMFPAAGGKWTPKRLGDGLFGVAVGLVLLGQMLGVLRWDVWLTILRLWPLLLVALGLEVLGKGLRTPWLGVVGSLILVGGLAFGALVMPSTPASWPPTLWSSGPAEEFSEREPRDSDVKTGTARIDAGVGRFTLEGGSVLASAEGRAQYAIDFEATSRGDEAEVRIRPNDGDWVPGGTDSRMDVTLDSAVIWDLSVNAGVSDFEVDLREVPVEALDFNAGVSSGTLVLGDAAATGRRAGVEASVDSGVSALRISVPKGQDVRITVKGGLLDLGVPAEWSKDREGERSVYESPSFSDSGAYWDITITSGIGSVEVGYTEEGTS